MIVHLDTCGCVLTIGPDGEPDGFDAAPCERHVAASVADVVAQCRAKNAAVAAAGGDDGLVWGFDHTGTCHVGTVDALSGEIVVVASSEPLTLFEFAAATVT